MKKLISILLAVLMLASALPLGMFSLVVGAEAAPATPTIRVEAPVEAARGGQIKVAVCLENNPGIISLKLAIDYDETKLELIAVEESEHYNVEQGPLTAPFVANWIDAIHPNNTANGAFVTLHFAVKADAAEGVTPITVSYEPDDLFDYDFNPVVFDVVNDETTVVACTPGDVDGNGKVNIRDLGLLQQHLNGWDVTIDENAANVDGNTKVNIRDLGLLQQYLNGWDIELQ